MPEQIWHRQYMERRRMTLLRIGLLRQLGAPYKLIRCEQLFLWGFRQYHYRSDWQQYAGFIELPGWMENYRKFALIHHLEPQPTRH